MLQHLSISNYALIKSLEIDPDRGLNMVTGETGAGKSIRLGAIGLLLGKRADSKVLFDTSRKCIIEGTFDIRAYKLEKLFKAADVDFDEECIIRREISTSGKSRAFVNDGVVNLDFLKALGEKLMDVHSQHDTLLIGSNAYQLELIDAFAGNVKLKDKYLQQYSDYREKVAHYEQLVTESESLKKEADYNQFLFEELDKAAFQEEEQESLENDLSKLENAEEIKLKLNTALQLLDQADFNINGYLVELRTALSQISNFGSNYEALRERVDSTLIELKDITGELEQEEGQVEYDPTRTEAVQERLSLLYKLQQKHQVSSIKELQEIHEALGDRVLRVENLDDAIEAAEKSRDSAIAVLNETGNRLSESRKKVFGKFEKQIQQLLAGLGMPNAQLEIGHEAKDCGPAGKDHIDMRFSANKGVTPQALKNSASGGEFSRLMFAVKYVLADKTALPTIVFDEIDSGISGEIAIQMAEMMTEMAQNHQVITITHLPQMAAKGNAHYFVYKEDDEATTSSAIKRLSPEERLQEIAQMIGGKNASESAMDSARELINSL